jgi:ATP-binding cassette subfamily B multidrug efflux pump
VGAVYFAARTAMAVGRDLRADVFDRVLTFSAREVGQFGAPSLITRTTNDVQQVQLLALMTFTLMVSAPIMCVGGILMALNQDVPLSALLIIVVPLLAVIVTFIISRMRPLFRLMQERIDRINQVLREQITGIRVIRAFVRDTEEQKRFAKVNAELFDVSQGIGRLMAYMFPLVMLVMNVSSVAVLWFGGHRIDSGAMQIGALTAFLTYLMQILMAVMMATFMFMMVPRAEVCAERIQEVLDTDSSVVLPTEPTIRDLRRGYLELREVEYRLPGADQPVLHGINLHAQPGEITAVIGSTGSGKTTLLNLIPRLIDTTAGVVLVDGVDVRELDGATLSAAIGFVPQKPYLFTGTVASNLRYGNPEATDAELWHALEVAQARDFVEQMTGGLQAPIAQGGTNVSGGQRQRLAIARALVSRPEIYLFDDSFSALDYATDAALRAALARETAEATMVIVAQRVSTIRHADRIVVLDEGRVVGTGSHQELMDTNDVYREIVLSQLTAQEAA